MIIKLKIFITLFKIIDSFLYFFYILYSHVSSSFFILFFFIFLLFHYTYLKLFQFNFFFSIKKEQLLVALKWCFIFKNHFVIFVGIICIISFFISFFFGI